MCHVGSFCCHAWKNYLLMISILTTRIYKLTDLGSLFPSICKEILGFFIKSLAKTSDKNVYIVILFLNVNNPVRGISGQWRVSVGLEIKKICTCFTSAQKRQTSSSDRQEPWPIRKENKINIFTHSCDLILYVYVFPGRALRARCKWF